MAGAIFFMACVDIPTGSNDVLSFRFAPLPAPAVVLGDTLRDSLGVASPVEVNAFNFQGDSIIAPDVRFFAVDRGIQVDSLTGIVTGDSVRTGARILATLDGLSGTVTIAVTPRPDSIAGSNDRDSLFYALADTTTHRSAPMGVKVLHVETGSATPVPSWIVSFRIVSPADTAIAHLVNDAGGRSSVDTTDATGVGARRIKLDVTRLTALEDSVIVEATVKYRGVNVRGSPARLVLKYKPK
jgi:hypothetical protein